MLSSCYIRVTLLPLRSPTTNEGICDILHIRWRNRLQPPFQLQAAFAEQPETSC